MAEEKFADILYRLRTERGMTQERLARKAGLCTSTIGRFEIRDRLPSYKVLKKLHKALGCTWEELFGEE